MKIGVYKITNIVNGKFYIGSSKDLVRRKKDHFRLLKKGNNHSIVLQRAYNKYGADAFTFEILAHCPIEYQFILEQWFVDHLKPCYNISIEDVRVPSGPHVRYKNPAKYKSLAKERLKTNDNFGWKSRAIEKLDNEGNVLQEYLSLKKYAKEHNCSVGNVGKALKKGNKCKGFNIRYKEKA